MYRLATMHSQETVGQTDRPMMPIADFTACSTISSSGIFACDWIEWLLWISMGKV